MSTSDDDRPGGDTMDETPELGGNGVDAASRVAQADQAEEDTAAEVGPTSPLSEAIQGLQEENVRLTDRLLRTAAELENHKKRTRRELSDRIAQAEDRVVLEFLPVADNLERALSHGGTTEGPLLDGVKMVQKQFQAILERFGITPVEALGQAFDPEVHEAVQQMASEYPAGSVCVELQKGYRRPARLVRPALVVVSLGPPSAGPTGEADGEGKADGSTDGAAG